jgi:hypothetical protein
MLAVDVEGYGPSTYLMYHDSAPSVWLMIKHSAGRKPIG